MGLTPERPLVFVHFPKASGTSIRNQLSATYGERFELDYGRFPPTREEEFVESSLRPGSVGVCGHFRPMRYDALGDAIRATFLREPVDNAISNFFFLRRFEPNGIPLFDAFLREKPPIEVWAATYPGIQRLMSDLYFGGYDMGRFDFIGFVEHLREDLTRFGSLVGMTFDPDIRDNPTAHDDERAILEADESRMRALREILADDVAFYERSLHARSPSV